MPSRPGVGWRALSAAAHLLPLGKVTRSASPPGGGLWRERTTLHESNGITDAWSDVRRAIADRARPRGGLSRRRTQTRQRLRGGFGRACRLVAHGADVVATTPSYRTLRTGVYDQAVAGNAIKARETLERWDGDCFHHREASGSTQPVECGLIRRPPVSDIAVQLGTGKELDERPRLLTLDERRCRFDDRQLGGSL